MINLDLPHNFGPNPDPEKVEAFERRMTAHRLLALERDPWALGDAFDLTHLQAVHHHILQDSYPWAGQLRGADQWTQALGELHCDPARVPEYADAVLEHMSTTPPPYADAHAALDLAAEHWANLTYLHAFADGNSRTQRAFVQLYLRQADWDLDWSRLDPDLIHATRHVAYTMDPEGEYRDFTWLSYALAPAIVPYGEGSALDYPGHYQRDERTNAMFLDMIAAKEDGIRPAVYFATEHNIAPVADQLARLHQLEQERLAHEAHQQTIEHQQSVHEQLQQHHPPPHPEQHYGRHL